MPDTKWDITRFELAYFNPRHRRWQLFQDDPTPPEDPDASQNQDPSQAEKRRQKRYRSYIQGLLCAVREAVGTSLKTTKSSFRIRAHLKDNVIFPSRESRRLVEQFCTLNKSHAADTWDGIIDYLNRCMEFYGLSVDDVRYLRKQFLCEPAIKGLYGPNKSEIPPVGLSRRYALAFLSILPILEHWDLLGALSPLVEHETRSTSERIKAFTDCLLAGDNFYAAQMEYGRPCAQSPSKTILGYSVEIEAACFDKLRTGTGIVSLPNDDFFNYCYRPSANYLREHSSYLGYAYFFDAILGQLQKGHTPGGYYTYFIAYPLWAMGCLHYLQIHVSPRGSWQMPAASDLCHAWLTVHNAVDWVNLASLITQQLEFIAVSFFISDIQGELTKEETPKSHQHWLCRYAYDLYPFRQLELNHTQRWEYAPYTPTCGVKQFEFWFGYEWKPVGGSQDKKEAVSDGFQNHASSFRAMSGSGTVAGEVNCGHDLLTFLLLAPERVNLGTQLVPLYRSNAAQILSEQYEICKSLVEARTRELEQQELQLQALALAASSMRSDSRVHLAKRLDDDSTWRIVVSQEAISSRFGIIESHFPRILELEDDKRKQDQLWIRIRQVIDFTWRHLMCRFGSEGYGLLKHPGSIPATEAESFLKLLELHELKKERGEYEAVTHPDRFEAFGRELRRDPSSLSSEERTARTRTLEGLVTWARSKMPVAPRTTSQFPKMSNRQITGWQHPSHDQIMKVAGILPSDVLAVHKIAQNNAEKHGTTLNAFDYRVYEAYGDSDFPHVELLWEFTGTAISPDLPAVRLKLEQASTKPTTLDSDGLPDIARIVCYRYQGRFEMLWPDGKLSVVWDGAAFNEEFVQERQDFVPENHVYYRCVIGDQTQEKA